VVVVAAAASVAAVAAVVVVVVLDEKLAFGAYAFSTFYAQHKGKAFGAERVYWACRPRAAWVRHACVGRV